MNKGKKSKQLQVTNLNIQNHVAYSNCSQSFKLSIIWNLNRLKKSTLRVMNKCTSERITNSVKPIKSEFVLIKLKFSGSSYYKYLENSRPSFRNFKDMYFRYRNMMVLFTTQIIAIGYNEVASLPLLSYYGKLIITVEVVRITNSIMVTRRNILVNLMNLMSLLVTIRGSSLSMLSTILIFSILNIK